MHVTRMANCSAALWRLVRGSGRFEHHSSLCLRTGGLATTSGYATEVDRLLGLRAREHLTSFATQRAIVGTNW